MSTPTPQPDVLLDALLALRAELQAAGFDAGPQRLLAARNLLLALAAQGRLPNAVREWKTWLGPVFCAAPGEQEEFYLRFDEWENGVPICASTRRRSNTHKPASLKQHRKQRFVVPPSGDGLTLAA